MEKIPPELIGKIAQDHQFHLQLLNNPDAALAGSGYELDDDQIGALLALDPEAIDRAIEELVGSVDSPKWG